MSDVRRRELLGILATGAAGAIAGCGGGTGGENTPTADVTEEASPSSEADSSGALDVDTDVGLDSWPMLGANSAHTGTGPDQMGPTEAVTKRWSATAEGYSSSAPAVVNGVLYMGSGGTDNEGGTASAFSATDGRKLWQFETERPIYSSPVVDDGTVYIGTGWADKPGKVYALSATAGTEAWSSAVEGVFYGSLAVQDGTVYARSNDDTLYALNAAEGSEQWTFDGIVSSPTVADGTVYASSASGGVVAVGAADGSEQWRFDSGGNVAASPAVADGTVYCGNGEGVYAIDADEGTRQWRFEDLTMVTGTPTVRSGRVLVGARVASSSDESGDTYLFSLDAADGSEQWRFEGSDTFVASATVTEDTVYAPAYSRDVYGIAVDDGSQRWSTTVANEYANIAASPAVADGTVYVGTEKGGIYALWESSE
ncbi:PQQ-binding-like beta-propeller repeat protein [Halomicroarcula sp. F28]|uniref:outer membrane protein assembly factor BamB family protein n=1 Tax=Haloarcula salinisoli TaxID=2487746 RepID=UPI001C72D0CB|nr:PQQ-binding-like beta-propeller repeat protein [Halomicroarcula salinisoli]MBX0286439.1 PQQ-binding-like beta-propeller repeat protein [Halomicroarcula salinisoli]